MCGICGKINLRPDGEVTSPDLDRMIQALSHRGPDGSGKFVSGPVGLGHTRLAIIDLSTGDQPMTNETGTIWLVYNGEIYNYRELREELAAKGHRFQTQSDSEVIVHLYEEYGVGCLQRLRGMFAFAIWDGEQRTLLVARDRLGIKPLYYTQTDGALRFASEIKALLRDGESSPELDLQSIHRFLTFLYLPGDRTLFGNITKLEPGHYLLARGGRVACHRYWDLEFPSPRRDRSLPQAGAELRELVSQTVRDHLASDVPVGVLLSGGIDSTVMLGCVAEASGSPVDTFTIGFDCPGVPDERPFARLAADRFGANYHETTISAGEFLNFLPAYVRHMEEPVCEAPAVALYYVAKLARAHVKVVISGEGGDEAFGGYQTYRNLVLLERLKTLAGPLRPVVGTTLERLGGVAALGMFAKYGPLFRLPLASFYYSRVGTPFSHFNRHRKELCTRDFYGDADFGASSQLIGELFATVADQAAPQPALNQMLYVDSKTWLPDDLLIKADKMTMANSLELRVPLLDHKVLEFAARLPTNFKVNGWNTKRILKRAFKDRLPPEILNRPKAGLPVPVNRWLREDLTGFVHDVLLSDRATRRGYFRREAVERLLKDHAAEGTFGKEIFSLLTLELWHREFVDAQSCP